MDHLSTEHIEKTRGGKVVVAGHHLRVMDIVVWHEMQGYSAEEIAGMFPGVTLADIHAALAYYFDHRAEIDEELRKDDEQIKRILARHTAKIRKKPSA